MTSATLLLLGTLVALIFGCVLFLSLKALLKQHAGNEDSGAPEGQFQIGQSPRSPSAR